MTWAIEFERSATRDIKGLDRTAAKRIIDFLYGRVAHLDDPASLAEPLVGPMRGLLRWRVGDYRVLGRIDHGRITVIVVEVGHRREVYR